MQVTLQDCVCVALPDKLVAEIGLSGGTVPELFYDPESRTFSMTAPLPFAGAAGMRVGTACRVGIRTK